jgi:hypothetical protein
MRISPDEFRSRDLRVHAILHGIPLEDAWAIRLSGGGVGRTILDLLASLAAGREAAPTIVQWLFRLRFWIGALLGWDRQRPEWKSESFAHRLSPVDRARSSVPQGTPDGLPDGLFSLLYRFDDEQLSELRNTTVRAFMSLSIQPAPDGYSAFLGVFAQPVHGFTGLYMKAIAPFRRLIVYPAIIRKVEDAWADRYGGARVTDPPQPSAPDPSAKP